MLRDSCFGFGALCGLVVVFACGSFAGAQTSVTKSAVPTKVGATTPAVGKSAGLSTLPLGKGNVGMEAWYHFKEVRSDNDYLYLRDKSRNLVLAIPLAGGKTKLQSDGENEKAWNPVTWKAFTKSNPTESVVESDTKKTKKKGKAAKSREMETKAAFLSNDGRFQKMNDVDWTE